MKMPFSIKPLISHNQRSSVQIRHLIAVLCFTLLSCISVLPQSPALSPKITNYYDRFKDETTVGVSTMLEDYTVEIPFAHMQEFILLLAGFTHKGQQIITQPMTVRLAFQSQARRWRFGEGTELYAIVDGERLALGPMSYSRQDLGAGHVEVLRLDIPARTFLKLARAKAVELRVGDKELKLGTHQLAVLAALADQMTGVSRVQASDSKKPTSGATGGPSIQRSQQTLALKEEAGASAPASVALNKCPVHLAQLLPLRRFNLGMSLSDVTRHFQGGAPPISQPNGLGIRSMEVSLSRPQDPRGSTGLDKLKFKFVDNRLYQIEATYSLGKEWKQRPMMEFAGALSRGLGVDAVWAGGDEKEFVIACGEVRFDLSIDDESYALMPSNTRMPLAVAYLTLTDTATEAQIKLRSDAFRQREKQRDAERRRVFRP
jgi:hypothetical protein